MLNQEELPNISRADLRVVASWHWKSLRGDSLDWKYDLRKKHGHKRDRDESRLITYGGMLD